MAYTPRRRARRGVTLAEVLVALVLAGVVGGAMTRLVIAQTRAFDKQTQTKRARAVARGALGLLMADARMVAGGGGVVAASAQSLTLRVPYAMGILCQTDPAVVSLLPGDRSSDPNPTGDVTREGPYGYAWRDSVARLYHYVESNGVTARPAGAFSAAACAAAQITTLAGPDNSVDVRTVTPAVAPAGGAIPRVGDPVLLYQRVTYHFAPSQAVPGAVALWRTVSRHSGGDESDELAAPFAQGTAFTYYVGAATVATAAPTAAQLPAIRGLRLTLNARSDRPVQGTSEPASVALTTAVFFQNR